MSRPIPRSRRRSVTLRQLFAGLFLASLGGVLVGCGGGDPKPAGPVAQVAEPTKSSDRTAAPVDPETRPASGPGTVVDDRKEAAAAKEMQLRKGVAEGYPVTEPRPAPVNPGLPASDSVILSGLNDAERAGPERLKKAQEILRARTEGGDPKAGEPRDGAALEREQAKGDGRGVAEDKPAAPPGGLPPPPPVGLPAVVAAPKPAAGNPADPATAESYNLYRENEYRSPLVAKFSTFSADVNTASYSNVRRFLTEGRLPPKDAVFLAEFVNYFPYQYARPTGDDPVAFNLELGPCPWNRRHHLVRVGVQARQLDPKDMPPRNLVFLIDTSGSMNEPNRLPLVQKSLGLLIDGLTEKDSVGIVTYAGTAGVALPPTGGREKEKIRGVVDALGAGGSTNGEGGIKAAYELARRNFNEAAVNRVILCTDGDFNVGVSNQGDLVRMIEDQRKSKVFLTVLGFGMGNYKDGTLKELANHGNGHHAYIDTLDEAKKVFVEQGGALVLVAKDVKLQVEFNPGRVTAYRLVGYENRLLKDEDFKNDAKDAGDMGSGHQVTALYEIVPVGVPITLPGVDGGKYQTPAAPNPAAPDEWLTVAMRYKHPEADTSKELSKPLKGDVAVKDLSDDFRFAAAAASFGMLLRDSEFKGGMTYAGVIEEAQGAVGKDPGGHRAAFLELAKKAQDVAKPKAPAAAATPAAN